MTLLKCASACLSSFNRNFFRRFSRKMLCSLYIQFDSNILNRLLSMILYRIICCCYIHINFRRPTRTLQFSRVYRCRSFNSIIDIFMKKFSMIIIILIAKENDHFVWIQHLNICRCTWTFFIPVAFFVF